MHYSALAIGLTWVQRSSVLRRELQQVLENEEVISLIFEYQMGAVVSTLRPTSYISDEGRIRNDI